MDVVVCREGDDAAVYRCKLDEAAGLGRLMAEHENVFICQLA